MNKITVIVPVYNVEKYIAKCLESLVNQTFKEYSVLVVNDGSPDNSIDIINKYKDKYPNIINVIDKENGGYGSVLSEAIKTIDTEYFIVCDPDDYLEDSALEYLYDLAIKNNADITIGAKTLVYSDNDQKEYDCSYNKSYCKLNNETTYNINDKDFNNLYFIDPSPHSKLYKKTLATNIMFPEKVSFTDNILFYCCMINSKTIVYTEKSCAYYLIDRVGNTMTDIKPKVIDDHVIVFSYILNYAKNISNIPSIFYYRIFESYKFIFREINRINAKKDIINLKCNNVYNLVKLLKPHFRLIKENYEIYAKYEKLEKKKDYLLFSPLSRIIFNRNVKKLIENKYE